MKEGIIIIVISKNEAKYLRKNKYGGYIHNGNGTYHRYYLTENQKVLQFLEKYRKSIIVEK